MRFRHAKGDQSGHTGLRASPAFAVGLRRAGLTQRGNIGQAGFFVNERKYNRPGFPDQVPAERIALVHLNDAKDVPREQAKDSDRTYPGQGVIPLEEMLGKLVANGYAGAVSVEIFGDCQEGDPDEVARRAYESASALIAAL